MREIYDFRRGRRTFISKLLIFIFGSVLLLLSCSKERIGVASSNYAAGDTTIASGVAKEYTAQLEKTIMSMKILLGNFKLTIDEMGSNLQELAKKIEYLEKRVDELESEK